MIDLPMKYKLISPIVKATYNHPEYGPITFDSETIDPEDYEWFFNNGFDSLFVRITHYKNIDHGPME